MNASQRLAAAVILTGWFTPLASAQAPAARPSGAQPPAVRRPAATAPNAPAQTPKQRTAHPPPHHPPHPAGAAADSRNHPSYSSVIRHRTPQYPVDSSYGYRNPGGVGRFEEYYPPGNQFQNGGRDPVRAATFGAGAGYDIQEQAMATQVGVSRYNALQQHMDNFSRPVGMWGWGMGWGAY